MYVEQYLVKQRQQERLRQAEEQQAARQVSARRRLQKRRERAERQLVLAWRRVDHLRELMTAD